MDVSGVISASFFIPSSVRHPTVLTKYALRNPVSCSTSEGQKEPLFRPPKVLRNPKLINMGMMAESLLIMQLPPPIRLPE